MPDVGVQIAKLSPFRSFVVLLMTALTLTIMAMLQFRGGTITYVIVSCPQQAHSCVTASQSLHLFVAFCIAICMVSP